MLLRTDFKMTRWSSIRPIWMHIGLWHAVPGAARHTCFMVSCKVVVSSSYSSFSSASRLHLRCHCGICGSAMPSPDACAACQMIASGVIQDVRFCFRWKLISPVLSKFTLPCITECFGSHALVQSCKGGTRGGHNCVKMLLSCHQAAADLPIQTRVVSNQAISTQQHHYCPRCPAFTAVSQKTGSTQTLCSH